MTATKMSRRRFVGLAGGPIAILAVGGVAYRAVDQGMFSVGQGPVHFYDHTAHAYLSGICEDWGMRFYGSHSAAMFDLQGRQGQAQIVRFAEDLLAAVAQGAAAPLSYAPVTPHGFTYTPGLTTVSAQTKTHAENSGMEASAGLSEQPLRPLIVADGLERSANLAAMVTRLAASFNPPAEVLDLAAVEIKSGCIGCLQCGLDNECVFEGKDDFTALFRDRVMAANLLFFASDICDRYLSARWKSFFDRSFFRGHAPSLDGKQAGWIIAGPLRQLPNLRQIVEAYTEMQGANLVGIVTEVRAGTRSSGMPSGAICASSSRRTIGSIAGSASTTSRSASSACGC